MKPPGGIERVVSRHIHYFAEYAHVCLLTKDSGDSFYSLPDTIKKISLNYYQKLDMTSVYRRIKQIVQQLIALRNIVRKTVNQYNPDTIYCCYPLNVLELFLYGVHLRKVLVTEHGSALAYNKFYRIVKRLLYQKCLRIVAPTTLDYEIYKNWTYKARYIPNPIPFTQNEKAKLEEKTVLNIGRLTNDKQHFMLLDIWKLVSEKHTDWKLKIIGDGENKDMLLKKIADLYLQNTVEIMPPIKNIISEYIHCSIFLLTSRAEGFGMVLAEAMECGVPCIAFNCPSGPQDIITDGIDGYLIEPFEQKHFAEKIIALMENESSRKSMGDAASKNIQKFRESAVKEQWNNLIKEVCHE